MGAWHIHIEGHGPHDNNHGFDVDQMAKAFIVGLKQRGHKISRAEFTLTGKQTQLESGEVLER